MSNVRASLSLFQKEAPVIFFKGCARGAREGERTEEPAAKALVFRFLRSLAVRRMLLAKNASWELVCHLNALFVSQWKFFLYNTSHRQPKRTLCGFGLQRSFGRNILELLVYYLMPNKCKNLKDMKSSCLSVCTSSL